MTLITFVIVSLAISLYTPLLCNISSWDKPWKLWHTRNQPYERPAAAFTSGPRRPRRRRAWWRPPSVWRPRGSAHGSQILTFRSPPSTSAEARQKKKYGIKCFSFFSGFIFYCIHYLFYFDSDLISFHYFWGPPPPLFLVPFSPPLFIFYSFFPQAFKTRSTKKTA